jgi:integrase
LLIKTNGKKIWEFVYPSPTTNKRRKISLGCYPDVTLAVAREIRAKYRSNIKQGKDPAEIRKQEKIEKSQIGLFKNVVDEWLDIKQKEVKNNFIKPKTYDRIVSLMNDVVHGIKGSKYPNGLGNIKIQNIKHSDISNIVEAKSRIAPVSAKRMLQYLNRLWLYAISKGYCKFNIISNIDKSSILTNTKIKHHPCIDEHILPELVNAIYDYRGHYSVKNALKLVLHLPLRAGNLVSIQWQYVDFKSKKLTIPRYEMKVSDDRLGDFILPLTDEVINILKDQYSFTSNRKYIFASDTAEHINQETTNRALQRMGFNDERRGRKQRTHGFRSLFRSMANTHLQEHNVSYEAREAVLDHSTGGNVERAYTHKSNYDMEIRKLLEWWSGFIVKQLY